MPRPSLLLPLVLSLLCVSCGPVRPAGGEAPRADELPRLSWTEEARIGSHDDPDAGFSRIGSVHLADDGTLWVLETQALEVRVFGPGGERLRSIGGPGDGPGEFRRPWTFGLLGDTLWVRDTGTGRISWFGPDGSLVLETPLTTLPVETDVPGMGLFVMPGEPLPGGLLGTEPSRTMTAGAADRPYSYPVVRFDRRGRVVDTLRWDTVTPPPTVRVAGRALFPPSLRPTDPVVEEVDGDSLVLRWSVSEEERDGLLDIVRIAGADTLARRGLRYQPMPVPGSVMDSLLEGPTRIASMYGASEGEMRAAMRAGIDLPPYRPPLRSTHVGRDGALWVELNGPSPDSADWVVLDSQLAPRGLVTLPLSMDPAASDGDVAWVVETDEFDVPWLVRLRVGME